MAKKSKLAEQKTLPVTLVKTLPVSADIAQQINKLSDDIDKLRRQMEKAQKEGATPLARGFVVMRKLHDKFDDLGKKYNALFDEFAKQRVPEAFEAEGVDFVPLAEGYRVGTSASLYASIKKDFKDKALLWLKKNGLDEIIRTMVNLVDADDKAKKKLIAWIKKNGQEALLAHEVNASTLSAAARYLMEEKNIELPEEFFNTAIITNTSVTVTK